MCELVKSRDVRYVWCCAYMNWIFKKLSQTRFNTPIKDQVEYTLSIPSSRIKGSWLQKDCELYNNYIVQDIYSNRTYI